MAPRWVLLILMMGYDDFLLTAEVQKVLKEADLKRRQPPSPDTDDTAYFRHPEVQRRLKQLDRKRSQTPSPPSPTATEASQRGTQGADDDPYGDNWMASLSPRYLKTVDAQVAECANTARNVPNHSAKPASTAADKPAADATKCNLLAQFDSVDQLGSATLYKRVDDDMAANVSTPANGGSPADSGWGLSPIGSDLWEFADAHRAGAQPPTSIRTGRSGSNSPTRRILAYPELSPVNAPFSPTSPSYTPTPPAKKTETPAKKREPKPAKKQQPEPAKKQEPTPLPAKKTQAAQPAQAQQPADRPKRTTRPPSKLRND